jgi:hypothetical protein
MVTQIFLCAEKYKNTILSPTTRPNIFDEKIKS